METNPQLQAGKGLWSCPRASQYSKETQEMLRIMMQESKLTNFQQRQIKDCLNKGAALPVNCDVRSRARPPRPAEGLIPCGLKGLPARPQRRSAESCRSGDGYSRERFHPRPTRDLEEEKRRLQYIMSNGKEKPKPKPPERAPPHQIPDAVERDRFQEVLDEIEERRIFLEDMTALGQGKHYHNLINSEISQRIRELELMDESRSAELRATLMPESKMATRAEEKTGGQDQKR
ncbi:UPF0193 protein EVG1 [Lampris incognitus]|uniref:UPF0193 protein EVG1 n=1 Tax=Lampris incognitus TaxID=2546036 RepID=UPI0024B498D2|nr:UPF0193 protein EVG1 [Lampris incognitus]